MLKILTSQQIKELDTYSIQHEPIASIVLMERACNGFVSWFTSRYTSENKIGIICGTGNNGGDGLGVARLLSNQGYDVKVWIVKGKIKRTLNTSFTTLQPIGYNKFVSQRINN